MFSDRASSFALYTNERNFDDDVESEDSSDNDDTNIGTVMDTNDDTGADTKDEMGTNNKNERKCLLQIVPIPLNWNLLLSSLTIYLLPLLQLPRRCYILVIEVLLLNWEWTVFNLN